MITEEEKSFYNECMDCRTTRDGTIESDDMGEFFRLVNEYADNKYRLIIGGMKCSGNCTHDDTRIRCEETKWVLILAWVLWIVATAYLILKLFTTIHNC